MGEKLLKTAVLLMSVGSPENLDDMEKYLLNFRHGRPVSPEFVAEIRSRYQVIGRSPLLPITNKQALALQRLLDFNQFKIYVGMRYWHPFIESVVQEIESEGFQNLVSFPTTPYYSEMSVKLYHEQVKKALSKTGAKLNLLEINHWNTNPHFLTCWEKLIQNALNQFPKNEPIQILFTAHSLPERILSTTDPYPAQYLETATLLAQKLGFKDWAYSYQSQGGSREPWLGPTVEESLKKFEEEGVKNILLIPVGFVSDHVEILYDIDILFKRFAKERGMRLLRTAMPNDHSDYIAALKSVVLDKLASPISR